ncbi:hypothetical protein CXB51_026114 [Gossypium anomalum]|uniref:Uncharacterized protein n=1 Tax=Gossypium anomalum TaxID=47600 RepID=A0A8J5YHC0_9ROSI|nr:hypothetical protein CXB51_026114 [Gossypium anomalum]
MEGAEVGETLKVLDASLSHIKWRLKSSSKRRLQIDVLAVCTRMRPVVMIDYGGKMPELQENLCALCISRALSKELWNPLFNKLESTIFEQLRVMVIEDMIYLIHVKEMAEYVSSSLSSEVELLFVDLEQDPPRMKTLDDKRMRNDLLPPDRAEPMADSKSLSEQIGSQSSVLMDLSSCMHDTEVTVPTVNGWLLGYPIVYLFSKDHIEDAIYNLSTKFLRIYKILVSRTSAPNKRSQPEELMSFSVPYELSMRGSNEPWVETFLACLQSKWGRCKHTWSSLEMEVSECYPQAIAL